jgi:hypothetical protein
MKLIDLTGQVFGRWAVIGRMGLGWLCRCACGAERVVDGYTLRLRISRSCGCGRSRIRKPTERKVDFTGQTFGRLTVTGYEPSRKRKDGSYAMVACACTCGKTIVTRLSSLKDGTTKSCGCLQRESVWLITHGHAVGGAKSKELSTWTDMKQRCFNSKSKFYAYYGGRGITVCDRWLDFENFFADMGEKPEGLTLDRVDVNGNYELGNCRWATWKEQGQNKRKRGTC